MKKFKKIMALMMAMAMVLGMSVTTFAAPNGYGDDGVKRENSSSPALGTKADKGSITISGVTANKDEQGNPVALTVTAYKIIEAKYENDATDTPKTNGKFSGYADVYTDQGAPDFVNAAGEVESTKITEENLAAVRAIIESKTPAVTGITMASGADKTSYTASDVEVGTYLVVIDGAEGKIYSNMVVSVQYVNADGSTNYVESADLYLSDGMALAKVQNNPTIKKEIVKVNGTDVAADATQKKDDKVVANTANVGDVLQFKITADIPSYSGKHPAFKVTDDLTGLTYKYDISGNTKYQMTVEAVEGNTRTSVTGYKIANVTSNSEADLSGKNQIVLDFVDDSGTYILQSHAGKKLEITYYATVDATAAKYNQDANENTVKLEYTHNSNVSGDDDKTPGDKTKTYTFDLSGTIKGSTTQSMVNKVDAVTTTTSLDGAEFKLYQKNGETLVPYKNAVMTEEVGLASTTDTTMTTKVVSSAGGEGNAPKGAIVIRGLAAGTYYLKETKAPNGYSLSDHEYVIVVNPTFENGELKDCKITVDGKPLFTITKDGSDVTGKSEVNGQILNTKLSALPSTGGIGTTIFTIGGCAIMILAAGLYFASRRKAAK